MSYNFITTILLLITFILVVCASIRILQVAHDLRKKLRRKPKSEQTSNNPILMMVLFLAFIREVWSSISELESGLVFMSFIAMLAAICFLFAAYEYLSDSLEESLKASQ